MVRGLPPELAAVPVPFSRLAPVPWLTRSAIGGALLVHACYHKAGTVWFKQVLRAVAADFGLPFSMVRRSSGRPLPRPGIGLDNSSVLDYSELPPFRGTHMVRDPRDMLISGYHYHLWTEEAWANVPIDGQGALSLLAEHDPTCRGRSYREYLNDLPLEQGLFAEMLRMDTVIVRMAEWNRHRAEFLELRYEDVITSPEIWFERVFRHYGFGERAVRRAVTLALGHTIVPSSSAGGERERSHRRSGRPEQWRDEFTPALRREFCARHGLRLVALGYERSVDW